MGLNLHSFVFFLYTALDITLSQNTTLPSVPTTSTGSLKLQFYVNVDLTQFLTNYTSSTIAKEWLDNYAYLLPNFTQTLVDVTNLTGNPNTPLCMPRTVSNQSIGDAWYKAIRTDTEVTAFAFEEALRFLINLLGVDKYSTWALLSPMLTSAGLDWESRKIPLVARSLSDCRGHQRSLLSKDDRAAIKANVTAAFGSLAPGNWSGNLSDAFQQATCAAWPSLPDYSKGPTPLYVEVFVQMLMGFMEYVQPDRLTNWEHSVFIDTVLQNISTTLPNLAGANLIANFTRAAAVALWKHQFLRQVRFIDGGNLTFYNITTFNVTTTPPVSSEVMVVVVEIAINGTMDSDTLYQAIQYQNRLQNLTVKMNGTSFVMWLIDDGGVSHPPALPTTLCSISMINFVTAMSVTGYFVRQLRKSERYQQFPMKEADDEDEMI